MRAVVSRSGWQEQPAIRDMARIQFGQSTCQIEGTYVPVADFKLTGPDSIYFSHHTLLWAESTVQLSRHAHGGDLEPEPGRPAPRHDGGQGPGPPGAVR